MHAEFSKTLKFTAHIKCTTSRRFASSSWRPCSKDFFDIYINSYFFSHWCRRSYKLSNLTSKHMTFDNQSEHVFSCFFLIRYNRLYVWMKVWKRFRGCFDFESRVSTKTVVIYFSGVKVSTVAGALNNEMAVFSLFSLVEGINIHSYGLLWLRMYVTVTFSASQFLKLHCFSFVIAYTLEGSNSCKII